VSFTAWDSLIWPALMNTSESGKFRIREFKTLLEWTFTPQWRTAQSGSDWQDFKEMNPGRARGVEVIRFSTMEEAEEFIQGAFEHQPILQIHEYDPEGSFDWRPLK
jgi:hypothetical protein